MTCTDIGIPQSFVVLMKQATNLFIYLVFVFFSNNYRLLSFDSTYEQASSC